MTNEPSRSSDVRGLRLSSMPLAVSIMIVLVLFMLAGVLPVRDGTQAVIFETPVFGGLLGLLIGSLIACSVKRRPALRSMGFHLTHLGVVVILVGAFIGALTEKKFSLRLYLDPSHPPESMTKRRGDVGDLPFELRLVDFQVSTYDPDFALYKDGEMQEEVRVSASGMLELGAAGRFEVRDIIPQAQIVDFSLAGEKELLVFKHGEVAQRIIIVGAAQEAVLDDGTKLQIIRSYSDLRSVHMGASPEQAAFPVDPGLIVRVVDPEGGTSLVSVPAGKKPVPMTTSGGEMPDLLYQFPVVSAIHVEPAESGVGVASARLLSEDGVEVTLVEGSPFSDACLLADGYAVRILRAAPRQYHADVDVETPDGEVYRKTLSVNHALDIEGWRFYLDSYDTEQLSHVTLTARKDPGDGLAVAGMYSVMIGIGLIFYVRKRRSV